MENLMGGTPPVRYLPCVVPCKLYFAAVMTADGEREMIGIFGTKEPDAAWERRVLQRYPILRGSVKYIQIEELPRTMNGKLDYKKLQQY